MSLLDVIQWLFSPVERSQSPCTAPASTSGQYYPRAFVLVLWLGGPAGSPWHEGQRWPGPQREPPTTYRLWKGDEDDRCTATALSTWGVNVPPSHPAIEGSENGGRRWVVSDHKSGRPWLCHFLVYLWEERNRGWTWSRATVCTE